MNAIFDANKGAIIETTKPHELKMYLVRDSMRDDSQSFGLFIHRELECLIEMMNLGVKQ